LAFAARVFICGGYQPGRVMRVRREIERNDQRAAAGLVRFQMDRDEERSSEEAGLKAIEMRDHFTAAVNPDNGA
jgi:preprotein translocase subunit Sec61beta